MRTRQWPGSGAECLGGVVAGHPVVALGEQAVQVAATRMLQGGDAADASSVLLGP